VKSQTLQRNVQKWSDKIADASRGNNPKQVAELSHRDRAAACPAGWVSFGQSTGVNERWYSARNDVGAKAMIFLHDVRIPVESQHSRVITFMLKEANIASFVNFNYRFATAKH